MTVVYTGGTFDLFHEGHIELLKACKKIAGKNGLVVVALNTDDFIERFKGKPPVQSLRERKLMLESCRYVDLVMENTGEENSTATIEYVPYVIRDNLNIPYLTVDIVAIGTDWASKDYYAQMGFTKKWLDEKDITLIYIDRRTGQSTTNLKEKLRNDS